jgi:iron complex outermembrane recepter protein
MGADIAMKLILSHARDSVLESPSVADRQAGIAGHKAGIPTGQASPNRSRKGFGILASALLAMFAMSAPVVGVAQESGMVDQSTLEEIIVTATKREESIIDVPIAVTEISAATIQQYNIQSVSDFELTVPNLSFTVSPSGNATSTIRGVSGSGTTATYIDDSPAPAGFDPRLFDLASLEVLKGPQGTLYGESSMGGNIRYVTQKPSFTGDNSGSLMVQAGGTAMADSPDYGFTASGNFVLIPDRVAFRISGVYQHDAGWVKNAVPALPNDPAYVAFIPAQGFGPPGYMVNVVSPSLPRTLINEGDTDSLGASASLRVAITDSLESTTGAIFQQKTLPNGANDLYAPGTNGWLPVSYVKVNPVYSPEYYQSGIWMWYEDLTYKGNGFTVTSATSYIDSPSTTNGDGSLAEYQNIHRYYGWNPDTSDLQPVGWVGLAGSQQYTEEIRLAFDKVPFIRGLSGIVGLFGSFTNTSSCLGGAQSQAGSGAYQCVPVENAGQAAQGIYPTDEEWLGINQAKAISKAIFGELYYTPIEPLTFTVGLRYYWQYNESQETEGAGDDNNPSSTCIARGGVLAPPYTAAGGNCVEAPLTSSQSGLIPKYAIQYKLNADTDIYASRSQGFRPGGPAPTIFSYCQAALAAAGETLPSAFSHELQSDKLVSWEVGIKSQVLDRRLLLTADAFDIEWTNKQQSVFLPACFISDTVNLGAARIQGGEFELIGKPIPNVPLDVHFAVGVAHTYVTEAGPPGTAGAAPVGSELLDTPEWTGSLGLSYTFPFMTHHGFVTTTYSYTGQKESSQYTTSLPVTFPAYRLLSARLGIRLGASESTEISLYGNNLTNAKPSLGDFFFGGYDASQVVNGKAVSVPEIETQQPVSIGLQVRTKF